MNDAGLVAFGATRDDATSGVFLGDNAHIEAFNSLVRRECLSQHWFRGLEEVEGILEAWKDEYNNDSPPPGVCSR